MGPFLRHSVEYFDSLLWRRVSSFSVFGVVMWPWPLNFLTENHIGRHRLHAFFLVFVEILLLFCLRFADLLTFDRQVNSVRNNRYREWRPTSRKKRSVIAAEIEDVVPLTGRRQRTAQLVPRTRVKRSDQLNGDAGTRFDVGVAYQPAARMLHGFLH